MLQLLPMFSPSSRDNTIYSLLLLSSHAYYLAFRFYFSDLPQGCASAKTTQVPYPLIRPQSLAAILRLALTTIPPNLVLVYRAGDQWEVGEAHQPRDTEGAEGGWANLQTPIADLWRELRQHECLDSANVPCTTIDPVRFAEDNGVNVKPGRFSGESRGRRLQSRSLDL